MNKRPSSISKSFKIAIILFIIFTALVLFYPPISPIINGGIVIAGFFIITILLAFYNVYDLHRMLKDTDKDINDAISFIDKANTADIDNRFHEIKAFFNKNSLKDYWQQFDKTIRRIEDDGASDGEKKKKHFATTEAGCFFNEDIIMSKFNNKIHNYIPQLLTAIGIFGTFLGLVLGLQTLHMTGDVQKTKDSIQLLINGIKISFKTSLYGILYSMIITFYEKYCLGDMENKVNLLASKLDGLFPKNTQEDGIKEIYLQLERQTSSLQKLSTDFAEQVGKKFDVSLQENLTPTLIKLGQATEKLVMMSQNTNESAIRTLFDSAHNLFANAANEEINGLKNSLKEITDKNGEMFDKFANSIKIIEELMQNQKNIISQTNLSAGNVEKTNVRVENLSQELSDVLFKLSDFSKTQNHSNEDSRTLLREIKENISYQNEASLMISNILKENLNTIEVQQQMYGDLREASSNLNKFGQYFTPVMENLTENMTNFKETSESINNKFLSTIDKLDNYYDTINNSIANTFEVFDKSTNQFKNDIIENLTDINKKYSEIATKLNNFSENSVELTQGLKNFAETQKISEKLWTEYKESFDNLNGEIKEGVKDYTAAIRGGLNDIFKQYDDSISNVFEKIYSLTQNLNDSIEELGEIYDNAINKGA